MNGFVDFLNSMHSVTGNSLGALAERQVRNSFANKCHIPRAIGKYIQGKIEAGPPKAWIITGHAGDGKTSILVQILRELKMLPENENLRQYKECINAQNLKVLYIKDMSEINLNERARLLSRALEAPDNGLNSILISNTGPLLSAFESLLRSDAKESGHEYNDDDALKDQTLLLNHMDQNTSFSCQVGKYEFIIINIARIDNTSFASAFLDKFLQDDNWYDCESCQVRNRCPVYYNVICLQENKNRVLKFIESYYRYMFEYDQRMTIRQIQSHLCYAITGGLTCERIINTHKDQRIQYNFANLFFGYHDRTLQETAMEIMALEKLSYLHLDEKKQDDDYILFVKEDYSVFPDNIKACLEPYARKQLLHAYSSNVEEKKDSIVLAIRKMVRRFYLMYSNVDEKKLLSILNRCFGDGFVEYVNMKQCPNAAIFQKRKMRDAVFQALYMDNTGFLPKKENSRLPITLHRNDTTFQNVLLVLGEVEKEDLSIIQEPMDDDMNDIKNEQKILLSLHDSYFPLNLPLYQYFEDRRNGIISSSYNPSLTHNIANLETFISNNIKNKTPDSIRLLCNTSKGQEIKTIYYDENNTKLMT